MRISRIGPIAIAVVLLIPATTLADTYTVFSLGAADAVSVYGIDSSGLVVMIDNLTQF